MRRVPLLTVSTTPLCRPAKSACVACCRGGSIAEPTLLARLRRQTRRFPGGGSGYPSRLRLVWHELTARRGLDLLLAVVFLLPGIGPLARRAARGRMCCAFLGFPNGDESRPGCLLHPSLWDGTDRRRATAFRLLPGYGCREPGYLCPSAVLYRVAPLATRQAFRQRVLRLGWFEFSVAVERLEDEILGSAISADRGPGGAG